MPRLVQSVLSGHQVVELVVEAGIAQVRLCVAQTMASQGRVTFLEDLVKRPRRRPVALQTTG